MSTVRFASFDQSVTAGFTNSKAKQVASQPLPPGTCAAMEDIDVAPGAQFTFESPDSSPPWAASVPVGMGDPPTFFAIYGGKVYTCTCKSITS